MARPSHTLIVLLPDRLIRADFDRSLEATLWHKQRPPIEDIGLLVDTALRLGPKAAKQVHILHSEAFNQLLPLPLSAVRKSDLDELTQALKFEAESLSGLSAFEAELGVLPAQVSVTDQLFWVCSLPQTQLQDARQAVEDFGSQLAAVLPCSGVPLALDAQRPPELSWLRVEFWPDSVVALRHAPGQPTQRQVIGSAPELGLWQSEYESWLAEVGQAEHKEALFHAEEYSLDEAYRKTLLNQDEALSLWLKAWARAISAKLPLPAITPKKEPLSTQFLVGLSIVLAVLTAIGCLSHHRLRRIQADALSKAVEQEELPVKNLKALETQVKKLEKEEKTLTGQVKDMSLRVRLAHSIEEIQRQRLARLLRSLGMRLKTGMEISELRALDKGLVILGRAESSELPNQLASALAKDLDGLAWRIQSARTQFVRDEYYARGGYWSFEIPMTEKKLEELPSANAAKSKRARQ